MNFSLSFVEKLVLILNLLISSFVINCSFNLLFEIKYFSLQNHQLIKKFTMKNLLACFEEFSVNLKISYSFIKFNLNFVNFFQKNFEDFLLDFLN